MELGGVKSFDLMLEGRERSWCSLLQMGMLGVRPTSCSRGLEPFACWHEPRGAGTMGSGTGQCLRHRGDCNGCHRMQILAAYFYFFRQLVFWGPTNVSAPLLFSCAKGTAPALHFPSRAKDRLKLQAFTAAQASMEGGGDLGCGRGGLVLAWGAFSGLVWAQQCMLALGFFGTCEVPKAWVETLLCHQVFLAVPGAFTAS